MNMYKCMYGELKFHLFAKNVSGNSGLICLMPKMKASFQTHKTKGILRLKIEKNVFGTISRIVADVDCSVIVRYIKL